MFAHALIQEGIYDSLLRGRRRELHQRAAQWFARRDLVLHAEHLARAEDPAAPQAYLAASRAQTAGYHYERARRLVQRGLAIAVDRHDIFALTCLHGEILHDLGAVQESIDAYQSASTVAQDDVERCHAWLGLAAGMRMSDRHDEALAALDQAEKAARTADLIAELSRIHHLRGNIYFPLGNIEGCVQQHDLALRYAREASSAVSEARALGGLGDAAYVRGQMLTAHRNFRRCVEVCREHGFGRIEVANSNMAALTRQYANELPQAAEDALAAAEAATRVGHHRAQLLAHNIAAFALYDLAELARARNQLERAAALIEHISARRFVPENRVYLAKICRAEGRLADARALLDEAIAASRETGIRFFGPRVLVEIALSADDEGARNAALEEGERLLGEGCVGHNHLWFYRDAIDAALSVDDWDGAERYASRLTAFTHDEALPWSDFFIARGRALAEVGRGQRTSDVSDRLRRLRDEAARAGLNLPAQAIKMALAA
jgi:tetratricopeptide (TPR) repeat protein